MGSLWGPRLSIDQSAAGADEHVKRSGAGPPAHDCPHLRELDGEDGVRPAADVIHPRGGGGPVDVSCVHKLFNITIILH